MYERANKSFPLIPDLVLKGIKRAQVSPPILRHMEIARREKQRQRASNDTWEGKSEGKSSDSEASGSLSDMPSHKPPVVETDKDPGLLKARHHRRLRFNHLPRDQNYREAASLNRPALVGLMIFKEAHRPVQWNPS